MTTLNALQKLYFIMDSFGNFYRLNADKELVAAQDRRDASTFSYLEIHERIGNGKRSQFYKAVPADELDKEPYYSEAPAEEGTSAEPGQEETVHRRENVLVDREEGHREADTGIAQTASGAQNPLFDNVTDLAEVDWKELLQNLIYINAMLPSYKDQLRADHSRIEQVIIDILHYVELYDYDDQNALEMMDRLREAREKRRIIKNEIFRVERFQSSIGSNGNAIRAKEALQQIKGKENGTYRPRVAPELFKNVQLRPRNLHKYYAQRDEMTEAGGALAEDPAAMMEEEQDMDIRYERIGTVYDDRKTDWLAFVRSQTEFFRDAEQHISDLQCDLESIDAAIEEALIQMEDANYNVTQGYRAFKELKDLRNERKEVLAELEAVQMIAERFDCAAMLETYEGIEAEMAPAEETGMISGDAGADVCEDIEEDAPSRVMAVS